MKIRFTGNIARDNKIKAIKVLRTAYAHIKLGLKDAKDIIDALQPGGDFVADDMGMPDVDCRMMLRSEGIVVTPLTSMLQTRLKNLTIAAIREGDTLLATDLLAIYSTYYPRATK